MNTPQTTPYTQSGPGGLTAEEARTLEDAAEILSRRFRRGRPLPDPAATAAYLKTRLSPKLSECFCVLFLDNQHRVIAFEEVFVGTINSATVYPREIVRRSLELNSAAVIFAHNHPSGISEPSAADRDLTQRLKDALALIDIRVLDHIVVGGNETSSFAEKGLL